MQQFELILRKPELCALIAGLEASAAIGKDDALKLTAFEMLVDLYPLCPGCPKPMHAYRLPEDPTELSLMLDRAKALQAEAMSELGGDDMADFVEFSYRLEVAQLKSELARLSFVLKPQN